MNDVQANMDSFTALAMIGQQKIVELTQTHSRNIFSSEGSLILRLAKVFLNRTHSYSDSLNFFSTGLTQTRIHQPIIQSD